MHASAGNIPITSSREGLLKDRANQKSGPGIRVAIILLLARAGCVGTAVSYPLSQNSVMENFQDLLRLVVIIFLCLQIDAGGSARLSV